MNQVSSELLPNEWKAASSAFELDVIEDIKYRQSVFKAELSLHEFLKQAWRVIEGGVPFIDNWHLHVVAEHLEACYRREIKNLILNVPPRSGKTSLISVAFPAWVWLQNPEEKFMYASYAHSLSEEHGALCLALIQSDWYQQRWKANFNLTKTAISFLKNNRTGYRIATSVGGVGTGFGASILIVDDPNNAKDLDSEAIRKTTNNWWNMTWPSRRNNADNDVRILVQQRTQEDDVTGNTLSRDHDKEWTTVIIPMEYEGKRKFRSVINQKVYEDPRTIEGELLCPARWSQDVIKSLKNQLGEYGYAGQYQQRPAPAIGGIIKKPWFQWWKDSTPPQIEFTLQSWDTALTANEMSAYSACTTWGVFYDSNHIENVILLSMWRGRVEYPELRELAKRMYFDYRDNGKTKNPAFKGRPVEMCLIEAKASGDPLIQDLVRGGIRAIPFVPNKYGDKIQRVRLITPLIEGGRVWLPARAPKYDTLLPYADEFLESVACFPNAESRDLVDTMAQALLKLKDGRFVLNPRDERPVQASTKEIVEFY
jgi:predicted phage terminase large subunit-like protein